MNYIKLGDRTIRIEPEWRTGFLAVWIIGMLAHAYRFFNFLPTWDSMFNFTGTGATFYSGRCFLGFASGISSKYDMPWVNGALSLLYISIAAVLLIDLFGLKEKLHCILLAGLIVSFPTVTSTFAYMFTADGYMLAFLLSVAGIWVTWKYKHGIWAGILFIGISMGTYQAYISVALTTVLVLAVKVLLLDGETFKEAFLHYWKILAAIVGGAVFYKIADGLINAYYGIELTAYQGINSVGILSFSEYLQQIEKTKIQLKLLWCLQNGIRYTNKYGLANVAVVCGIVLGTIILVIKKKAYKSLPGLIVSVISIILLPFAAFSINFVSVEADYHTLMEMGVCFVYLLLLVYIAHGDWKSKPEGMLKCLGILVLAFLVYFNTINANIAYNSMNLSYEKSYGVASNILDRIEQLDEYPDSVSRVAIMGSYSAESSGIDALSPSIMGVSQSSFLWGDFHYISMWDKCFGRQFGLTTGDEKSAIMETAEYQEMPVYPAKGSVAVINGIIVVKLSE